MAHGSLPEIWRQVEYCSHPLGCARESLIICRKCDRGFCGEHFRHCLICHNNFCATHGSAHEHLPAVKPSPVAGTAAGEGAAVLAASPGAGTAGAIRCIPDRAWICDLTNYLGPATEDN
jgi:hypothetical protein